MVWWIVVAAVVVALALVVAGMRVARAVAAVLVVAVVVAAAYVGYTVWYTKPVPLSDVEIDFSRVTLGHSSPIIGTVHNRSTRYTVTAVEFQLTLRDCVGDDCTVLGVYPQKLFGLSVAPRQTTNISGLSYATDLPPKRGEYRWEYRVVAVKGR